MVSVITFKIVLKILPQKYYGLNKILSFNIKAAICLFHLIIGIFYHIYKSAIKKCYFASVMKYILLWLFS